jgi:transposase
MASITKQRIGKYTYLYESTSFRDARGRPRNTKVKIGKIIPGTGETVYTEEYALKIGMKPASKKPPVLGNIKETLDCVKDYGVYWFLLQTAKKMGLLDIIETAFPLMWKEIFTLACYLIASDKPVMYCEDWLSENEWLDVSSMSSQRISELLCSFGEADRNEFYRAWYRRISENEYIALDTTSISSYSQNRSECEYGYNRDGDDLPQTNHCMLFGEKSKLPIYQTSYSGSLGDVSTLECTTAKFQAMFGENDAVFIMDKGFYSKTNVDMLLDKGIRFLVSVPFSNKFARKMIENERNGIDNLENVIVTSGDPIRGIQRDFKWNDEHKLHAHIFFNPEKALKDRNELFLHITKLKDVVSSGIESAQYKAEVDRYLEVEKSENGCRIKVRYDVVAKSLETSGWFLLISNHIDNTQQAFDVYRTKDVVEKSFWKYKNSLGLDRLRIHSDERAENKSFVAFIALILSSYVHNIMKDKQVYARLTFDRLLLTLAKLKSVCIGEHCILRPLTRQQKELFDAFSIPLPVG